MKKGKLKVEKGGRMMFPPMPWQNFRNLSEEDFENHVQINAKHQAVREWGASGHST